MDMRRRTRHPKERRINRRFIPNLVTVLNMFWGFVAIGLMIHERYVAAGWLILLAGFMDAIDGKLARLIGIPSKFGTEFDSLADTVSFCLAPSILVYKLYVTGLPPLAALVISFIPLMMGTIRLAKFNLIETPQPYYVGLTTPMNALLLFGFMMFNMRTLGTPGDPRLALVLVLVLGFLMNSPVRFAKLPLLSFHQGRQNTRRLIFFASLLIFLAVGQSLVIFPLLFIYTTWSILDWLLHPNRLDELMDVPTFHREEP
ncbi:MAG: CDP-diacylglycerol--serine O-phosphatidyltransferase [Candidatus Neomarinimicrobiota bacterium]|nr:MAG: CDP-diacylglycerol--serine O-phosphatidyltransferase [Candidatus Neomarinimicrobiota bacterium]